MFLKENETFPPSNWVYWENKYLEWGAWYSGDPEQLLNFYANKLIDLDCENSLFWARLEKKERENVVHLPAASDIASMSANLLFAETPRFNFDEKINSGERIKKFIEDNGFNNILLEGAELSAALSGVFLKIDIDSELSDTPIVTTVTPLNAFPTFKRGRLLEILFFREVLIEKGGTVVYRLFENRRNQNGTLYIEFKLYKGTNDKIGKIVDLNSIKETEILNLSDQSINVDGLGVVYIPNMRPNKLVPGSPLGINDYSVCVPLLDSLDLSWTSLVRDIELGMGQIFVDEELLQREEKSIFGTNKSLINSFSKFQKCFIKLNYSNYRMGGENMKPIENIQFEMRVEEHLRACEELLRQIYSQSGYSPSTFGIENGGRAESGTALRIRERKSFLTREKKSRYWIPAIKKLLLMVQQFDNSINNNSYDIQEVDVELEDSIIIDSAELSNTIKNLDQARAISTYLKVKMQHPDWNESNIMEEVDRIFKEEGIEKNDDIFNPEA